jgi:hypothetical protein
MNEAIFQTFLLLATFNIALISVTIANFAVSASYLGRETRLTRKRMEKRKQRLSEKLRELQEKTLQIESLKKEIKEAEKDMSRLNSRIFLLSWLGAVILPTSSFMFSFIFAVLGMNADILFSPQIQNTEVSGFVAASSSFMVGGFILLLVVIGVIDSAARKVPVPEFEVYFPDLTKTTKIKCKASAVITVCVNNRGEDMGENERIFVNFPPEFKVFELAGEYHIFKQGKDTDHPNFTAAIFSIDFHHIDTAFNLKIQLMPPDEKKPFQIPVDIYERKTERTKLELAIEVID